MFDKYTFSYKLFFMNLKGAQGEPGTKGDRGDPGLPVSICH